MTARWIKPPATPAPLNRPRCAAQLKVYGRTEQAWRRRHIANEPFRCIRDSVVEIDGEPYCQQHGGEIALHRICGDPT